jgi:UDP-N-acetyl-2-amino-2-deoxyglucuronate dehydrogenase
VNSTLGVVLVGSGIISHNHAAAIAREPRLRITGVVDPLPDAAERLAGRVAELTGTTPARYGDLTTALELDAADIVVVCSPSGTHAELAAQALGEGRHVLIEKPLEASLTAGRHLVRLAAGARARGQVCSVISQHRFDPASVAVAQAIAAGRFGRLSSAVASVPWWRSQDYYDSGGWRGTWALDGGGATMNQGVHTVDLLLWLLGAPVEVFGHTGLFGHDRVEVEDVAVATIRFASGALAVLHATTSAYPGLAVRLQIHGSRGSAVIHDDQLEYLHTAADGETTGSTENQAAAAVGESELFGADKPADYFVVGHLRQYQHFVDALRQGWPAVVSVEEALLAQAVIRAIYVSASLRRPVEVEEVLDGRFDNVPVAPTPVRSSMDSPGAGPVRAEVGP